MILFLAALSLAVAQDTGSPTVRGPARCVAVLSGPVDGCPLAGQWAATGIGPSSKKASRNALLRLQSVITTVSAARAQAGAYAAAEVRQGCAAAIESEAHVTCFPEEGLEEWRYCFARFDDKACWRGSALTLEGTAWRVQEEGRDTMCKAVDAALVERGDDEGRRLACQVRCLQEATVSCPR